MSVPLILYRLQPWPEVDRLVFDNVPAGYDLVQMARDAPPSERHAKLADADFLMGSWVTTTVTLTEDDFRAGQRLKLIQLMSAGYEHVDLDLAKRYGIPVAHFGGSNATVVAEHTIMLILALYRRLLTLDANVRGGAWRGGEPVMHELRGKRVGLIGMGYIGREVATRLRAFDAEVVSHSRHDPGAMPLDELLRTSDVVSLHVSLTSKTRGLIGARELALMRPGALLINTSRGPIVDQSALTDALQHGRIAGAGLDVLDPEPLPPDSPLSQLDNVILTPHNAGSAEEVWPRVVATCFGNIERVNRGEPPQHLAVPLD
ncbi:MAG TPA: 2-hydroxyacid dehydrogenase [Chloroflexota bacterium]